MLLEQCAQRVNQFKVEIGKQTAALGERERVKGAFDTPKAIATEARTSTRKVLRTRF
jgi:hypothetical protein